MPREAVQSGEPPCLASPADAFALFGYLAQDARERIAVAFLDDRRCVLAVEHVARAGPACAELPVARLLREAIRRGASALLLAHNHPTGDPMPSRADIRATRQLAEAAEAIGVPLLDHVIVARGGCCSLRLTGRL